MLSQIDHIVVVARDLERVIAGAEAAGFTVVRGGTHAGGETHNALVGFRDGTYIELLAFTRPDPAPRHYFSERHRQGGGLADVSLLSDDLDLDVTAISRRGVRYPIPTQLGRERPDDTPVSWRMSLPTRLNPGKGFPFLIEDTSPRALRVPSSPEAVTHVNGAIGVAGVTVVVPDMEAAVEEYRAILGSPPNPNNRVGVSGKGILRLPICERCPHWIALMQTFAGSAPEAYLRAHGPGPYAVNLRTAMGDVYPGEGTLIDPELMGGARFYL